MCVFVLCEEHNSIGSYCQREVRFILVNFVKFRQAPACACF
jgi:hypothetical protein